MLHRHRTRTFTLATLALLMTGAAAHALPTGWTQTQITDNDVRDKFPAVDGSNVVWRQGGFLQDAEAFLYDGSSSERISAVGAGVEKLDIHGSKVYWNAHDGNDHELYEYDIDTDSITQLTNNSVDDYGASASSSLLTWNRRDTTANGGDAEIMVDDGTSTFQLTDDTVGDLNPAASGNEIVWRRDQGENTAYDQIYHYDGTTTAQLTSNTVDSGVGDPDISGSNIVWRQTDSAGDDPEIKLYNGSTTTTLTDNMVQESHVQIDGDHIVWQASDDNDEEIYFYDGSQVLQVTNNDHYDYTPVISGSTVAWYQYAGYPEWEVFMAEPIPEPASAALLALGGLTLLVPRRGRSQQSAHKETCRRV